MFQTIRQRPHALPRHGSGDKVAEGQQNMGGGGKIPAVSE